MEKCFDKIEYRENQALAVTVAEINNEKVGIVTNVSREGFAFRYIDFGDEHDNIFQEPLSVNIVHNGYALYNFPCKSILECYTLSDIYISTLKMNKCCLFFRQLTPEQKAKLDIFIANCTESPSAKECCPPLSLSP